MFGYQMLTKNFFVLKYSNKISILLPNFGKKLFLFSNILKIRCLNLKYSDNLVFDSQMFGKMVFYSKLSVKVGDGLCNIWKNCV